MNIIECISGLDRALYFLINVALSIILWVILSKISKKIISSLFCNIRDKAASINMLESVVLFFVHLLLFLVIISTFFKLTLASLTTFLGAFGISASLAFKNEISNFSSGLSIILSKKVEIGDTVTINIGTKQYKGVICKVNMLNTVMKIDDKETIFANSMLTTNVLEIH